MSSKAVGWAFVQTIRPATDKLMLLAMAECANHETHECFPSAAQLVVMTGMNIKTVPASLDRLVAQGCLVETNRRVGKTMQVKVYEFTFRTHPISETPDLGIEKTPVFVGNTPDFSVNTPEIGLRNLEGNQVWDKDSPLGPPNGETDLFGKPIAVPMTDAEIAHSFQERWQALVLKFPAYRSMRGGVNETRARAIVARVDAEDVGRMPAQVEGVLDQLFERIGRSAFMRGENNRNWVADVEFILKSKNFTRIMEGSYDGKSTSSGPTGSGRSSISSGLKAYELMRDSAGPKRRARAGGR